MTTEKKTKKKIHWELKPEKVTATIAETESELEAEPDRTSDAASELVWKPGVWTLERLMHHLQKHGVRHGYDYDAMIAFLKGQAGQYVLARATPPQDGEDARVEWMVEIEGRDPREGWEDSEVVDYRAGIIRPSVPAETVLGRIIPPKAGKPGEDVFGRPILPKPGEMLDIVAGEGVHVDTAEGMIYSTRAGYLNIKQKKRRVYIQVAPVHTHRGNVSLASGNIELHGSLVIQGDVEEGMRVFASEDVRIEGGVHEAHIVAGEALVVSGSVFSSELVSGTKDLSPVGIRALNELKGALIRLLSLLEQVRMNGAVSKRLEDPRYFQGVMRKLAETQGDTLKEALQTLRPFLDRLIQEGEEKKKWLLLWRLFIGTSWSQAQPPTLTDFAQAVRMIADVSERYPEGLIDKSSMALHYAQNAKLYALGDVNVKEGLYLSEIQTFGRVKVHGFVRGGTIFAAQGAEIEEAGAKAGVETVIKVDHGAKVHLARAFPEVIVMIGEQTYRFTEQRKNVRLMQGEHRIQLDVI
ncbi:MAG: DUF342 domain-containing protein [Candidatus Carbobacillus altaicus]|nr:DUF342 domain-containing protein [Candidatus Carbobacillus altaicus]